MRDELTKDIRKECLSLIEYRAMQDFYAQRAAPPPSFFDIKEWRDLARISYLTNIAFHFQGEYSMSADDNEAKEIWLQLAELAWLEAHSK